MKITAIQKWGNSYAVRIPKTTVRKLNLKAGHTVEIREMDHGRAFSITPVPTDTDSFDELVERITKENTHGPTDWGKAMGKEVW